MPAIQPIKLPKPPKIKMPPACEVCGGQHDGPGYYLCLQCGQITCVGAALVGWTQDVIQKHARRRISYNSDSSFHPYDSCGPCIRIDPIPLTRIRLRKVSL